MQPINYIIIINTFAAAITTIISIITLLVYLIQFGRQK